MGLFQELCQPGAFFPLTAFFNACERAAGRPAQKLFYIYGFMCYATVLMLPFLMGGLLLLARTLAEKRWKRKVLLAILTGIVFQCGLLVRTNYLIVFVALAAYVLLHVRNGHTFVEKKIHGLYLACAAAAAMALCSFAYQAVEDRYVDFDYTDTQFTAPYYFMYSSSMEYGGSFNTADYQFIQQFPMKYDTYIEQGGTNVSGGQKQRLCIARALLKRPKILILDDSTSAVDTRTDALIRAGFRKFIPETTKIIIAQRVASVQDADRILLMNNGAIEAIGSHEELMKNSPVYREIYTSQNRINSQEQGGANE